MIFRNSILSLFRSPSKTILFTLIIFALTLALALSVSVWVSVSQFLEDCNNHYTTIGQFEYMGTNYPNDTLYDPAMEKELASFDSKTIESDEAVLAWEKPSRSFGYVDGFWRTDTLMPGKNLSIFVVGSISFNEEHNFYTATVYKTIYSSKVEDNKLIYIDKDFGTFQQGHYYLVFGDIYHGSSPILRLRPARYSDILVDFDEDNIPRMIDISTPEASDQFFEIPEDSILLKIAETLAITNNSVLVVGTDNLMALFPFHQEELFFVEGRSFTQEEYEQGKKVVVISELMASRLGISIGDTINLSVAISETPGLYNSYWEKNGFSYHDIFKVVGITNTVFDKGWYVYVPKSTGVPESPFPIGYTIGYAIVKNEDAASFFDRNSLDSESRIQLQIYDQGYSSVATPFKSVLIIVRIVTAICALVELAVLILFGFLYVYRQRETNETMLMLGAGKKRVVNYFLFSAGIISFIAATGGAITGYWLNGYILRFVSQATIENLLIDTRFSNGNLTVTHALEFSPELRWQLFLIVGAIVFAFSIITCFGFTIASFVNSRPSQKKPSGPKQEHRTSQMHGGSLKYAILSIVRGGWRSFTIPIFSFTVVIFFGQLASTSLHYQEQLNVIYKNTNIEGFYTDINGKQIGDLVINAYDVNNLFHSGHLDSMVISMGDPYYFIGISKLFDGTQQDIGPLYVPSSSFSRESLEAIIQRGPDLIATNNIRKAPEFFYADTVLMNFVEGYDETFLTVPSGDPRVYSCILPSSLMKEEQIALGDTVRLATDIPIQSQDYEGRIYLHYDLVVVGSFEKQGLENTIYAPLALFFDTGLIWGPGIPSSGKPLEITSSDGIHSADQTDILLSTVFTSTSFVLNDSRNLVDFKDYLSDYGYSQVHNASKIRTFLVLKDASFNNAVASIKQQIRYINILYPFLFILVGGIAMALSTLMITSRKQEFAIIRGLGATRQFTSSIFFFEQWFLCMFGMLTGFAVWIITAGFPSFYHIILITGFTVSYFLGCTLSIQKMNSARTLTILLDRD